MGNTPHTDQLHKKDILQKLSSRNSSSSNIQHFINDIIPSLTKHPESNRTVQDYDILDL